MLTKKDLLGIVHLTFKRYEKHRKDINLGFIKAEHIKLVTDSLILEELETEELNEMWHAVADYFDRLYCVFNENGDIIDYKPYSKDIEFYRDTKSAFLEVVNMEARKRRDREVVNKD